MVFMAHFPSGIVIWQAFTFFPLMFTMQVPQSPLLQL
jgi:hypothetical protein